MTDLLATPAQTTEAASSRVDHMLIARMVADGARVLDVGCDDGALLRLLRDQHGVDARGMELSQRGVNDCVAKGLSVIQGDADVDLVDYPTDAFDYVILSQTVQATRNPKRVLENLLRIGRYAIVSFPNFGHWRIRAQIAFNGRMPITENLSHNWYDTPNIHFCTIRDFVVLTREINAKIISATAVDRFGSPLRVNAPWWFWNFFAEQAVFMLERE